MEITITCDFIHPANPAHYGSESQYAVLAEALVRAGHKVNFIAAEGSVPVGNFIAYPDAHGSVPAAVPNELRMLDEQKELLTNSELIIDVTSYITTADRFAKSPTKNKGTIFWSLNGNLPILQALPYPEVRKQYHGVLLSNIQKELAVKYAGHNPDMVHVIYYGIDVERYKPVPSPTRDYYLFISRPHPDKGIMQFIHLAEDNPDEKFIMAFDMESADHKVYGNQAIKYAQQLPNLEYVPLNRSLERKIELYANAKALIVPLAPSYVEIMGLVFMEALSCGTPVITSADQGGQVELLNDKVAVLCQFQNYRDSLKKVASIDTNECRKLILNGYTSDIWAKNYVALAKKVIG